MELRANGDTCNSVVRAYVLLFGDTCALDFSRKVQENCAITGRFLFKSILSEYFIGD